MIDRITSALSDAMRISRGPHTPGTNNETTKGFEHGYAAGQSTNLIAVARANHLRASHPAYIPPSCGATSRWRTASPHDRVCSPSSAPYPTSSTTLRLTHSEGPCPSKGGQNSSEAQPTYISDQTTARREYLSLPTYLESSPSSPILFRQRSDTQPGELESELVKKRANDLYSHEMALITLNANDGYHSGALKATQPIPNGTAMMSGRDTGNLGGHYGEAYGYCLYRGNGEYTPLLPADMLPPISGVPARQTAQDHWITLPNLRDTQRTRPGAVGVKEDVIRNGAYLTPDIARHGEYRAQSIQSHIDSIIGSSNGLQASIHAPAPRTQPISTLAASPSSVITSRIQASRQASTRHRGLEPASNNLLAPPVNYNRREKIYCDKWIHDGTCAFTQQGCKYKHEMPADKETQEKLGLFQGFPAWWKKMQAEQQRPMLPASSELMSNEPVVVSSERLGRNGFSPAIGRKDLNATRPDVNDKAAQTEAALEASIVSPSSRASWRQPCSANELVKPSPGAQFGPIGPPNKVASLP